MSLPSQQGSSLHPAQPQPRASRLKRALAGMLILGLTLGFVGARPAPARADIVDDLNKLQRQQDELNRQIEALQRKKTTTQSEYKKVQADIAQKQSQLKKLQKDLAYLEAILQQAVSDVDAAEKDLADAETRLDERTHLLETRLRTVYEEGSVSYLEVLLAARDFSDFISRVELLQEIITQDAQLLSEVKAEREEVEKKKLALEERRAQIASLKDKTAAQTASVAGVKASLEQQRTRLATDLKKLEAQEDELIEVSNKLAGQISAIQAKLGIKRTGALNMVWPVIARITSPFGNRYHPILKKYKMHTGLDLGASMSTPIKAAESGKVIMAGWVSGYGNTIVIDHGDNVSTLYGHQSKLSAKVGDEVARGQVIGYVGSTGNSTGPHLHFEVRVNGRVQDPLKYLPPR